MSNSPKERTIISSYRFFFAFLGAIIVQGLNPVLVEYFGQGDDVIGYRKTMILMAIAAVVLLLITFLYTKERVVAPRREKLDLKIDLKDLIRNRPWIILFCTGLSFVTLTTLKQGVTMYYFTYYVEKPALAGIFLVLSSFGAMAGVLLTGTLSIRMSKRRIMQYSFLLAAISSAALFLAGPQSIALIFVLALLTEFCTGPIVVLFFAMLADAADYSEWKNHRRATGLIYSAGTLSMKFGTGVAGALTGWSLMAFGYVANVEQTAESLLGIRLLISVFPAVAALVGLVAFHFYPLTENTLENIKEELATR
jgi:GPH family glycoside/pentoside/hexuronide:cation symporter